MTFLCHGLTTTHLCKSKSQGSSLDPHSFFFYLQHPIHQQVSLTLPPKQVPSHFTSCKLQTHPNSRGPQTATCYVPWIPLYPRFLLLPCLFTFFRPHVTQLCQAYACLRTLAFVFSALNALLPDLCQACFFPLVRSLLKCHFLRKALPDCHV